MRAMQQWLDRFCARHPRLGIPGLMRYIVIGNALANEWGANKFTIFYLFGVILNIAVGFLVGTASMFYVNMSMFFDFATLFPNLQVLFFFIIPMKVKWLAWFDAAFFAYQILRLLLAGHFLYALIPIVAILNYLLFFASDIGGQVSYWKGRAQHTANQARHKNPNFSRPNGRSGPKVVNFHDAKTQTKAPLHKCAVCGKTDLTDPQMEFRYCSKCNGYYCYCADHINNHIHIQ